MEEKKITRMKEEHRENNTRVVSTQLTNGKLFVVQGYLALQDNWYDIAMYASWSNALTRLRKVEYFNTIV